MDVAESETDVRHDLFDLQVTESESRNDLPDKLILLVVCAFLVHLAPNSYVFVAQADSELSI